MAILLPVVGAKRRSSTDDAVAQQDSDDKGDEEQHSAPKIPTPAFARALAVQRSST